MSATKTMEGLGCNVQFEHYRFPAGIRLQRHDQAFTGRHGEALRYYRGISDWKPKECGGYTVCKAKQDGIDSIPVFAGVAECSPKDNFCYHLGRQISSGRALAALREWLAKLEAEKGCC